MKGALQVHGRVFERSGRVSGACHAAAIQLCELDSWGFGFIVDGPYTLWFLIKNCLQLSKSLQSLWVNPFRVFVLVGGSLLP